MTDKTTAPAVLEEGRQEKLPETGRPSGATSRPTLRALLILSISGTALALGWWAGNAMERKRQATWMSRLSAKNSLLEKQNHHYLLQATRAQKQAAAAAAEAAITGARLASQQRRAAELEQRSAIQQKAARDLQASYEKRWETIRQQLDATKERFKRYQEEHKESVREEARGETLGDLSYRDFTFRNAVIEEITPAGIDIRHDSGAARLLFPLLPPEMRQRFAYDPGEAAEHLNAERRQWLQTQAAADTVRLAEARELQELERRIAMRQAEKEVERILEDLAAAERSLAFCQSKLTQPSSMRSPKDYEWKIRLLKRDIVAYESQLEHFGIFR